MKEAMSQKTSPNNDSLVVSTAKPYPTSLRMTVVFSLLYLISGTNSLAIPQALFLHGYFYS